MEKITPAGEHESRYEWLSPQTYAPIALPLKPKREEQSTELNGSTLGLYWGDPHVHSSISIDPEGEPDELLHYARDLAQLDFVALTDNDALYTSWLNRWDRARASELAAAWTEDGRFVALEGARRWGIHHATTGPCWSAKGAGCFSAGPIPCAKKNKAAWQAPITATWTVCRQRPNVWAHS
jgi:hypothetical protein